MKPVRTVAVTGASGYIGEAVCRALVRRGLLVLALSRRETTVPGVRFVAYDLRGELAPGLLAGVDVVIHAATETSRGAEPDIDAEIAALRRLAAAADEASARLVFVSSQTARLDAPTGYGRLKALAEQFVLERNGAVVRPGQVYGGPPKALWGTLVAIARRAPAIPSFRREPGVQPIHVDDLAEALAVLVCRERPEPRIYAVADPRPIAFSSFIQGVAKVRFGRRLPRLPIPLAPLLWSLRCVGKLGVRPTFLRRLESLNELPRLDSAADMADLVPHYRRFPEGAGQRAGCDRNLLREAAILLRYATGKKPDNLLLRSYVRSLPSVDGSGSLKLSRLTRLIPASLALFDQPSARRRAGRGDALSRRIDLALLLSESSPMQADAYLLSADGKTRAAQFAQLALSLPFEGVSRVLDAVAGRWLDRLRPRAIGESRHGV
ncbi:NAD-dependent epimerase/dehydratase family protein [Bosea sp. UNC402CLCol]|uniref:NAD-dependent epimerase/dehydratase family protein n=1 Tax=Bosea sp. UNC402CLCol TaxID=1510531 RepID=UPI00057209EB|nr:NAD-dependent epimerase/dehydratase family protein [Bosea sp. UNC402CLCol]